MRLKEFIAIVGLQDKLPFVIDCDIKPQSNVGATKEIYPGLNLPVLGSLTMKEAYIFDALDYHSGNNALVARLEQIILAMAQELSKATGNANLVECVGHVYETPEEVQQHPNFSKYLEFTSELRAELSEIGRTLSNPMLRWAKATFLLMSRYDANWTFEQTTELTEVQLDAIDQFIRDEKDPAQPEELEGFETPESTSRVPELPEGK
jgi:hypothetical protein